MARLAARIRPVSLRGLAKHSAVYTVGNLAPKIGAFLLLPIYVRFLSQADYGAVALLTSFAGVLTVVYRLGLDGALMRMHFDVEGKAIGRLYSTLTIFTIIVSVAGTLLLGLAIGPFFESLFAGTAFLPLGALALALAMVGTLGYVSSVLFRATGQAGRFLALNLGAFIVSSIVSVVLIVVFEFGASGVLTGQLVGALGALGVTLVVISRLGGRLTPDLGVLREALKFGLPLVPHALAAWALRLADRWLIAAFIMLPAPQVLAAIGAYSLGYQLGYLISMLASSFNAAWTPYFFEIAKQPRGPRVYMHTITLVLAGLMSLAVGMSVLAEEIVAIIARPGYEDAAGVLPIVAFASVLQAAYIMFVGAVFLEKRTGSLAIITAMSASLNIVLNIVLIPRIGILGAAWATFASYALFAVATYRLGSRLYPIQLDSPRLAATAGAALAVLLISRIPVSDDVLLKGAFHLGLALLFAAFVAVMSVKPIRDLRASVARDRTQTSS